MIHKVAFFFTKKHIGGLIERIRAKGEDRKWLM